jgi:hypothetical protein
MAAAAVNGLAADGPRLIYTKSFPRSMPAYVSIVIDKSGRAEYKEAADDDNPLTFQLTPKEIEQAFAMADRLDHFKKQLESGLKVANTGVKTFRYENGAEKNEVKFNYSQNPDAQAMWDWFERVAETEQLYTALERSAKFEKLGVNQALLQLQVSTERKRVVAPQQFLPLLDRIAGNDTYMHMARERAASLADEFRKTESQ